MIHGVYCFLHLMIIALCLGAESSAGAHGFRHETQHERGHLVCLLALTLISQDDLCRVLCNAESIVLQELAAQCAGSQQAARPCGENPRPQLGRFPSTLRFLASRVCVK